MVELSEAEGQCQPYHRTSGVSRMVIDDVKGRTVTIVSDDGSEDPYPITNRDLDRLLVTEGQEVITGVAVVEGPKDPRPSVFRRG